MKKMKKLISLLLTLILMFCLLPAGAEESPSVRINELMASNKAAVLLDGGFPDWVELKTAGNPPSRWRDIHSAASRKGCTCPQRR